MILPAGGDDVKGVAAVPQRKHMPLTPVQRVVSVAGGVVQTLEPEQITVGDIGYKAFGLASLPSEWTSPYFVVTDVAAPTDVALAEAVRRSGISTTTRLLVRSSGTDETLHQRGALESGGCELAGLASQIEALRRRVPTGVRVHFVVQEELHPLAKGHLSNERRVAEDKRDWIAEVEASSSHANESHRISLRKWRDNSAVDEGPLSCPYRQTYLHTLERAARWAYLRLLRVHFEWVWDGAAIYLVQADAADEVLGGMRPEDCVAPIQRLDGPLELTLFREAGPDDFRVYRKLANAHLYSELGYSTVAFYVLDLSEMIVEVVEKGIISPELRADFEALTHRPVVIRTDGKNIPASLKQMLPRSDELRNADQAVEWLLGQFATKVRHADSETGVCLIDCGLCLIAHHFLPAVASAWCQARPDHRRVRIESLWGIPEGLYWHAYDVFDIDTLVVTPSVADSVPKDMPIREKRRFKERFVAPDAQGKWILHRTAAGPDWTRSIRRKEWLEEIAWQSRLIAVKAGQPVIVMWFIGVAKAASPHKVLPWYHEPWKAEKLRAAPRRKLTDSSDFLLQTKRDWEELKRRVTGGEAVVRVRVQPREPELIRDPDFVKELALVAKAHQLVIELEGGILSHAYYMLSRTGCVVECADLDEYATDEYEADFNKLVRDGVPALIVDRGESVSLVRLEGEALIAALRRKLVEEALEALDAKTDDQIAEELADLREVELSLMRRLDISEADVETKRRRKLKSRGGFEEALMLTKTKIAPSIISRELDFADAANEPKISSTISLVGAIPSGLDEIHTDKRIDSAANVERLFTAILPAHASGFRPQRVTFSLETQDGAPHEMILELHLDRRNSELRMRARLINRAKQLELGLSAEDGVAP